jgi:hypothetical protein
MAASWGSCIAALSLLLLLFAVLLLLLVRLLVAVPGFIAGLGLLDDGCCGNDWLSSLAAIAAAFDGAAALLLLLLLLLLLCPADPLAGTAAGSSGPANTITQ